MKRDRLCIMRQLVLLLLAYGDNTHRTVNESLLHKIDFLYNRIACFVSKWGYYTHHCTMFEELGWTLQRVRREINWKTIVLKTVNPSNSPYLSKLPARSAQIQICIVYMTGMLMRPRCHLVSPVRFSSVSIDPNPHTPRTSSQCPPTAVLHGRTLPAPQCVCQHQSGLWPRFHLPEPHRSITQPG